jgi:tetratricopeptide (TPR) repeat protein
MNNNLGDLQSFLDMAEEFADSPEGLAKASRFYFEAGKILWHASRIEEAKLYLRKALVMDPENSRARILLASPPDDSSSGARRRGHPKGPNPSNLTGAKEQ